MLQNFKRWYYQAITDPVLIPVLLLLLLYGWGFGIQRPAVCFPALLVMLALALWQKFCRFDIGQNFQALPALPGGYHTIGQRRQRREAKTCRELRSSLVQDSKIAADNIPAGKYQALTHETVLRQLEQSARISVKSVTPAYMGSLKSVLSAQSHNRCRRCKAPCGSWNAPQRQFYLVRFRVQKS